jgi:hypothetical protein
MREIDRAQQYPAAYSVAMSDAGGSALPAIVGPVPGRLTWSLPMPKHATFQARVAAAAAPVRVRIGVSDSRVYEPLVQATILPGAAWTSIGADLSAYAGWKFSLFYRPDTRQWRVNLSADAAEGIPGRIAWASPEIVASPANAREYAARRVRFTRSGAP